MDALRQSFAVARELFALWPHPWIALVACVVGMLFGTSLVQFSKVTRRVFGMRRLTGDEMKLYSGIISFVIGGAVAYKFAAVQSDPLLLLLHASAAGLFCPWVANVFITRLKKYDPDVANAYTSAFDGDITTSEGKASEKNGP